MTYRKMINGQYVEMTEDEIAARQAEEAAWSPSPPVATVTPLQARKALIAADLLDTVETWIANQTVAVQVAWEYASVVERDDPAIAAAATALEMTDAEVDALFIAAAQM